MSRPKRVTHYGHHLCVEAHGRDALAALGANRAAAYMELTARHDRLFRGSPHPSTVLCGETRGAPTTTTDRARVTCKHCLKELAADTREANEQRSDDPRELPRRFEKWVDHEERVVRAYLLCCRDRGCVPEGANAAALHRHDRRQAADQLETELRRTVLKMASKLEGEPSLGEATAIGDVRALRAKLPAELLPEIEPALGELEVAADLIALAAELTVRAKAMAAEVATKLRDGEGPDEQRLAEAHELDAALQTTRLLGHAIREIPGGAHLATTILDGAA